MESQFEWLMAVRVFLRGMLDLKRNSMEHDSGVEWLCASIFSIADDRETGMGQLGSNLVLAAGLQFYP